MFKNLKIRVRLGLGFALAVVLLAAISTLSLVRMTEIASSLTQITDDRIPKVEMAMLSDVGGASSTAQVAEAVA